MDKEISAPIGPQQVEDIEDPDLAVLISKNIVNDFLKQNLPYKTQIPINESQKINISVEETRIQTDKNNILLLEVTDAAVKYERQMFQVGLKSNRIRLVLNPSINIENDRLFLVINGDFLELDVKFIPKWVEIKIISYLKTKIFSPLVHLDITDLITFNFNLDHELGRLKFHQKPQSVAIVTNSNGIRVKLKYNYES